MYEENSQAINVFLSYSHDDAEFASELDKNLGALQHEGIIELWSDRCLKPGDSWNEEISNQLQTADLILLLVSSSFLKSFYCYEKEMRLALNRHEDNAARVVPIIVRDCYWQVTAIGKFQGLPRNMKPVSDYPPNRRDTVWREVAEGIHEVAKSLALDAQRAPVKTRESLPTLPAAREPLPPLPPVFVGRRRDLSRLLDALRQESPSPSVVLGGPGMGKSTLCIKAINDNDVINKYGEHRYYINLDGVRSADAMVAKIVNTIGIVSGHNPLAQMLKTLSETNSLLVIDNAEVCWWKDTSRTEDIFGHLSHLSPSKSTFFAALRGARAPLGARWAEKVRLQPLSDKESRELFLAITGIEEQDMDSDALDDILHALDGMPLAIVLMARRAETASLSDLAKAWQRQRTKMLIDGEAGGRDLNLEVSVEISIGDPRMADDAKSLLYLLGLLPVGIENDDLDQLLPDIGFDAKDKLVATGIAIRTEDGIRLLGPIREYIRANHKPSEQARRNLISYYFSVADDANKIGWTDGRAIHRRLSRKATNVETLIPQELASDNARERLLAVTSAISYGIFQNFSGTGTYAILEQAAKMLRKMAT